MSRAVLYRGMNVGTIIKDRYKTFRYGPCNFMHKYHGYGLSEEIINDIEKEVKSVVIVDFILNMEDRRKDVMHVFDAPLDRFIDSDYVYVNDPSKNQLLEAVNIPEEERKRLDVQKFVDVSEMRNIIHLLPEEERLKLFYEARARAEKNYERIGHRLVPIEIPDYMEGVRND